MNRAIRLILLVFTLVAANAGHVSNSQAQTDSPSSIPSEIPTLDLSNWDFFGPDPIKASKALNSVEWDIWPGQILEPDQLGLTAPYRGVLRSVLQVMNGGGYFAPRRGVFTARIRLKLPKDKGQLIYQDLAVQPTKIFINGNEVLRVGTVGVNSSEVNNERLNAFIELPQNSEITEIILQKSYHGLGWAPLPFQPLSVASETGLHRAQAYFRLIDGGFVLTSTLIALLAVAMAARTGDWWPRILLFFSSLGSIGYGALAIIVYTEDVRFNYSPELQAALQAVALTVSSCFSILALHRFLKLPGLNSFIRIYATVVGLQCLFDIVFPRISVNLLPSNLSLFLHPETFMALVPLAALQIAAIRQRHHHARVMAIFILPIFVVVPIELFLGTAFIPLTPAATLLPIIVGFLLVYVMIDEFAITRDRAIGLTSELEFVNEGLEKTIEARTMELRDALSKQTANSEILAVILQSRRDASAVFNAITASAVRLCDAKVGGFFIYRDGYFESVSHSGFEVAFGPFERFKPFPGSELERLPLVKQPIQITDLRETEAYRQRLPSMVYGVEVIGTRTLLWLPLLKDGDLFGIMNVGRNRVEPFDQTQIETLQGFAAQAVIAIENARVLNELEERTRQLEINNQTLRETQTQLVQAEKLASLGMLVAGVAHEINTPLGIAVTATSQVIKDKDDLKSSVLAGQLSRNGLNVFIDNADNGLNIAYSNLTRAADLVSSFKQVAVDQNSEQAREIDLAGYIKDILRSLDPILKSAKVQVEQLVAPGIKLIIQPGALAQVVTNLVQNAVKHAFDGISEPKLLFSSKCLSVGEIQLVLCDNGVGMDEPTRARAFDPFFTTKRGAGGTGLGLHIVHNLMTEVLKGRIDLDSRPGNGTEFRLTFPV